MKIVFLYFYFEHNCVSQAFPIIPLNALLMHWPLLVFIWAWRNKCAIPEHLVTSERPCQGQQLFAVFVACLRMFLWKPIQFCLHSWIARRITQQLCWGIVFYWLHRICIRCKCLNAKNNFIKPMTVGVSDVYWPDGLTTEWNFKFTIRWMQVCGMSA